MLLPKDNRLIVYRFGPCKRHKHGHAYCVHTYLKLACLSSMGVLRNSWCWSIVRERIEPTLFPTQLRLTANMLRAASRPHSCCLCA
ncbi:hypothetical protein GQ44DRAFT_715119 [Phaeosphaeriaceae sp. PMI808]|nr:hypothetical protein GQ44DRAFT_715119 [Phaeosphaeriaceae sp. PMI808]